jgi:microcystin-dependent protein
MVLEFQNGAQITHTGYTLTINGTVVAGRYQIFAGSGTVSGPTGEVPLEWSGAGTSLSVAAKIESYIVDEDDMASDSATKVPTQQSVKAYVTASAPITVLVGTVICWPLDTPPSGYKECNGDYLDTTTYADLYAVIGDTYGMFDGTHFYLPDYRGMFLRGLDGTRGVEPAADKAARVARGDGTGGNVVGTTQAGGNASHGHAGSTVAMSTALSIGTGSGGATADIAIGSQTGVASTTELTATPTIAVNGGNEARPVNINVLWCIKY